MQFSLILGKARPSFADKAVLVKPVVGLQLDLETVQPVPALIKAQMDIEKRALERMEAILLAAGVETEEAFLEIATETELEAFTVNQKIATTSERLIRPTLNASSIALALQGIGRHAPYMTKAVKRALRGAWLLDETEEA